MTKTNMLNGLLISGGLKDYRYDAGREVEEELRGGGGVYGYVPPESVEAPRGGSSTVELDEAPAETDEQG